jgi:Ca-activated chloride channel family protein
LIEQFHFLRPAWLLALVPLAWLIWHGLHHGHRSRIWQSVVDAQLLPHLLKGRETFQSNSLPVLLSVCGVLSILALAGPVWERLPQPVFNQQSALVIALDLSRSMDAGDVKPSRLVRARHKVADILTLRKEGQTALLSYAAESFVVTPLTEDSATISALLPSLSTEIMPSQGSRADKALSQAFTLFDNAGFARGDVLIVSDGFSQLEVDSMEQILKNRNRFRVSVLAVGTEDGGPIPLENGGFLKDDNGSIVISRLQAQPMRDIVDNSGGNFQVLVASDSDVRELYNTFRSRPFADDAQASDLSADLWREQGPWLLLLVLPLIALMFRRGLIMGLLVFLLPISPDALALEWKDLWQNDDQQGRRAFEQGDHRSAAELFDNPDWKAAALYRAEDYERALEYWKNNDSGIGHYNRGNALANLGKLQEAISAYEQALHKNPGHEDAAYNKKQLEELLRQQQQDSQQEQNSQSGEQQSEQDDSGQQQGEQGQQDQSAQQQNEHSEDSPPDGQQAESAEQQQSEDETDSSQPDQAENNESEESQQQAGQIENEQDLDQQMSEQSAEQWLRKIPDDPGGLLRRKFLYQYRQRDDVSQSQQPW